ncbi:NlpC/P60 family protein [Streptomyces sp. NPDC017979]|uniref:C40 family peptidase n=1 Tax=Streptomyces sp. NPDC017979 TaxID=3365024 RepID=UPI0037AA82E1
MASHRRPPQPGPAHGVRAAVLSAAAATAAALGAAPAGAEPHSSPEATRADVDRLFEEAEKATERFNATGERAGELRARVTAAQDAVARGQERVNQLRGTLGAVAGAQYRSGGLDPALMLLLSADPDSYLERAELLERTGTRQTGALRDFLRAQRTLGQQRAEARRDVEAWERSRSDLARHKRTVEHKLAAAQRLLNALPDDERAAHDRASRSGRDAPDAAGEVPASGRAAAAVAAVRSAIGRPYVWGANGPTGFDCSGLMQWSYAKAGIGLPRTSQAQRSAGRQVPLSQARPGDLVAYRDDASHIGMYVGGGRVVHAPYPGAAVRSDPVGMMPISSITRP